MSYESGMEKENFYRMIATDPSDVSQRLAFAGWFEKSGDVARAEFIRAQYALADMAEDNPARAPLFSRAQELLCSKDSDGTVNGHRWAMEDLRDVQNLCFTPEEFDPYRGQPLEGWARRLLPVFRQGFIDKVTVFPEHLARNVPARKILSEILYHSPVTTLKLDGYFSPTTTDSIPTMCPVHLSPEIIPQHKIRQDSLKKLRGLSTAYCFSVGDDVAQRIADCPVLHNLRRFDISNQRLTDKGVTALLDNPTLDHTVLRIPFHLRPDRIAPDLQGRVEHHNKSAREWQKAQGLLKTDTGLRSDGEPVVAQPAPAPMVAAPKPSLPTRVLKKVFGE